MEEIKIYNESKLDEVFLSYDKILFRLNIQKITTKMGKEITHKDLRYAIQVMQRKHKSCRWKSEKIRSRNSYILIEGYYWILDVYFNNKKSLIDADIEFFEERIKLYENHLKVKPKNLFEKDVYVKDLFNCIDRKTETIEKAFKKNNTMETLQTLKEKEKSLQSQIRKLLDMSLNEAITEEEYINKKTELEKN